MSKNDIIYFSSIDCVATQLCCLLLSHYKGFCVCVRVRVVLMTIIQRKKKSSRMTFKSSLLKLVQQHKDNTSAWVQLKRRTKQIFRMVGNEKIYTQNALLNWIRWNRLKGCLRYESYGFKELWNFVHNSIFIAYTV